MQVPHEAFRTWHDFSTFLVVDKEVGAGVDVDDIPLTNDEHKAMKTVVNNNKNTLKSIFHGTNSRKCS